MTQAVTQQSALDELISQGVAQPTWQLAPNQVFYSRHGYWPQNAPVHWIEPMPGRDPNPANRFSGFDTDWADQKFADHRVTLYEINESDGIAVFQARAIFSNPYRAAIAGGVDNATLQRMQNLGMELWVSLNDANLRWYSNATGACVYKELNPMPYETFKKTFRYFLLRHTNPPTNGHGARLKPNVLPHTLAQPDPYFFDHLADASERSVRMGLNNETAHQAWATLPGQNYIERNTFNWLWARYRSG